MFTKIRGMLCLENSWSVTQNQEIEQTDILWLQLKQVATYQRKSRNVAHCSSEGEERFVAL